MRHQNTTPCCLEDLIVRALILNQPGRMILNYHIHRAGIEHFNELQENITGTETTTDAVG